MSQPLIHAVVKQGAGTAFNALVSFALVLFLAREMGSAGFGQYAVLLSGALLGLILIEAGWPTLLYRETAAPSTTSAPSSLASGAVAHMLAVSAGLALISLALETSNRAWSAAFVCMGAVALMNLVSGRMRGTGRFGTEALWQGLGRTSSAVMVVVAVLWIAPSPLAVFLAWTLGLAAVLLIGGWRWLPVPRRPSAGAYALCLPFLAFEGLLALLTKADMAVLGSSPLSPQALSDYAACTRLSEAALLLFAPFGNVLLHGLRQRRDDLAAFRSTLGYALAIAGGLGSAVWLTGLALGPWLMPRLFGADFASAGTLLPWVLAALPAALGNLVLFQAALARGFERGLVWRMGLGAGLLVLGLSVGSRIDGARGAALAAAMAHGLLFALCFVPGWFGQRVRTP